MSRGFSVVATVQSADGLTVENLADEINSNGLLSEFEKTSLLPGAIAVAKSAVGYVGAGPYKVTLVGVDRSQEQGEVTSISVTVASLAVTVAASSAPVAEAAPVAEVVPVEPVVETPAPEVAPTDG